MSDGYWENLWADYRQGAPLVSIPAKREKRKSPQKEASRG